jgi:hypothetical protein
MGSHTDGCGGPSGAAAAQIWGQRLQAPIGTSALQAPVHAIQQIVCSSVSHKSPCLTQYVKIGSLPLCRVLSSLSHPRIVSFLGACLAPPNICILEELAQVGMCVWKGSHMRLAGADLCCDCCPVAPSSLELCCLQLLGSFIASTQTLAQRLAQRRPDVQMRCLTRYA